MKFRTEIFFESNIKKISHENKISTFGSCFADNIGDLLQNYKFNILKNPFGTIYNPISVLNTIKIISENNPFNEEGLIFNMGEWHSFYHYSTFSSHEKNECLNHINQNLKDSYLRLKNTNYMIITYGTSTVYKYSKNGITVSNCHKIPSSNFERFKLSIPEIEEAISESIKILHKLNSRIKLIFTISPIRHWKDGAIENQNSKSKLNVALHNVIEKHESAEYFPAYEIMMDDLRDYRYYSGDLLHPNEQAIDYIWEKFSSSYFSNECIKLCDEIKKVNKAIEHRPRNIHNPDYQQFVKNTLAKIDLLKSKNSSLDFEKEINQFKSNLT